MENPKQVNEVKKVEAVTKKDPKKSRLGKSLYQNRLLKLKEEILSSSGTSSNASSNASTTSSNVPTPVVVTVTNSYYYSW